MLSLSTTHSNFQNPHPHPYPRLCATLVAPLILENHSIKIAKSLKANANLSRYRALKFGKNLDNSWRCLCRETEGDANRSLQTGSNKDDGIDGISSRLEKQRNIAFRTEIEGNQFKGGADEEMHLDTSLNASGTTWSNQQARTEAAEISLSENIVENENRTRHITTGESHEYLFGQANENLNYKAPPEEVAASSTDRQELWDAIEFQENEFMIANNKLESLRAKLAVLEGKIELVITNLSNTFHSYVAVDEIGSNVIIHHGVPELRQKPVVIEWPNSASEVLLAGSFDGWTSKMKMEKSSTGTFFISLMLYPGNYEIKFIVDGKWKIDPNRSIVRGSGHKNNLLIVE